jgi:hypothetical protein
MLIPFLFCKTFDTEFKRNSSNYCSAMFRVMNLIVKKGYGVHSGENIRANNFFSETHNSETTFHPHTLTLTHPHPQDLAQEKCAKYLK